MTARAALVIRESLITRRHHMKAKQIKTLLFSEIKDDCIDSERNFLRNRKLSAETVIKCANGELGIWMA